MISLYLFGGWCFGMTPKRLTCTCEAQLVWYGPATIFWESSSARYWSTISGWSRARERLHLADFKLVAEWNPILNPCVRPVMKKEDSF